MSEEEAKLEYIAHEVHSALSGIREVLDDLIDGGRSRRIALDFVISTLCSHGELSINKASVLVGLALAIE